MHGIKLLIRIQCFILWFNYKLENLFPGCCLVGIIPPYEGFKISASENIKRVAYQVFINRKSFYHKINLKHFFLTNIFNSIRLKGCQVLTCPRVALCQFNFRSITAQHLLSFKYLVSKTSCLKPFIWKGPDAILTYHILPTWFKLLL